MKNKPFQLSELHAIKELSDRHDYAQKARHLRDMVMAAPGDWEVDSEKDGITGITHRPSGYRYHLPRASVPAILRKDIKDRLVNPPMAVHDAPVKAASISDMLEFKPVKTAALPPAPAMPAIRPIGAIRNGAMAQVHPDEVDYEPLSPSHTYAETTHMAPLLGNMAGTRAFVASKYIDQALPLVDAEAAFVDTLDEETGESYNKKVGKEIGLRRSKKPGTVHAIRNDMIDIMGDDGKLHQEELHFHFPSNRKTGTTDRPLVKVGDRVEEGQTIAHSNYVTADGTLALGKNLRVAFVPGKNGSTFEDAIAISESAAKRLTSSHLYGYDIEHKHGVESTKKKFISLFPRKYTQEQLDKIGDDGNALPGVQLNTGDPIMLAYQPRNLSTKDSALGNLHKVMRNSYQDLTQTWEKASPGLIADAVKTRRGLSVNVATDMPLKQGDKVSGRSGSKGVIGSVIPDDLMYHDSEGNPVDILMNPMGIIGRKNPSNIYEALLGKVAKKTGKNYVLPAFIKENTLDLVEGELFKHGIKANEDLFDPESGRKVPNVLTGYQYFQKLEHMSADKESGRGEDGGYDANGQPSKGGFDGCFPAKQNIRTMCGTMDIARICEKRLGVPVFTYSETLREWVFRPVIDWFTYRAKVSDILTIETEECYRDWTSNGAVKTKINTCLCPTKNHNVVMFDGSMKTAGELSVGEELVTWGLSPTPHQWELLYGSLLGDMYSSKENITCSHSTKQANYIMWKQGVLSGLNATVGEYRAPARGEILEWYQRTKGSRTDKYWERSRSMQLSIQDDNVCNLLRRRCYSGPDGMKVVTDDWISKLSGLSVAVWMMDDGWIGNVTKKKGKIKYSGSNSTHGFTFECVEKLRSFLESRYPGKCWISKVPAKDGRTQPYLQFSTEMCVALINEIAAWVPADCIPKSKIFLVRQVRKIQETTPPRQINSTCPMERVALRIKDIRPYSHDNPGVEEINVYDITVADTHTYVASSALVSNSKRLGGLVNNALLSHGATANLRDGKIARGSKNPEMWTRIRNGEALPPPKVPFIFDKFIATLQGAGINVKRKGDKLHLFAMTDRDVDELARHPVQNTETLDQRTGEPIKGGLFDTGIHGPDGKQWSFMPLDQPVPNPLLEDSIRSFLKLTKPQYREIIAGRESINGKTGTDAIHRAVKSLDFSQIEQEARTEIASGRKSRRDEAVKRLSHVVGFQRMKLDPSDLMMTKVPVIPPTYRPVSNVNGMLLVSDANYLYHDLGSAQRALKTNREDLPDSELGDEKLGVYDAVKAIQGLGDPINQETVDKGVKGFIRTIAGSGGPKCYDDETEILTENGWVPFPEYNDLSVKVATLNPDSHEMEFQNPSHIVHENYSGRMVHTKTIKLDLFVTEGHWHYVEPIIKRVIPGTNKKGRTREIQKARKVQAGDLAGKTQRLNYVVAADNFTGHTPAYSFDGVTVNPDAFAQFVGWWVAEGHLADYDKAAVCLSQKADTQGQGFIDDVLTRMGLKFGRRQYAIKTTTKFVVAGDEYVEWRIRSRELAAWMVRNCGSGSANLFLSKEILSWTKEHQLALLTAYLDGDGEKRKLKNGELSIFKPGERKTHKNMAEALGRSSRFNTVSIRLVNSLEQLCLQCGLGFNRRDVINKSHPVWSPQYRCRISGWGRVTVEYPHQTRLIENWNGAVHCVTVPNGLVFVRRNQKIAVSGNTGIFQAKVIGHPVNTVGRAAITPNDDLNMDEVGLPEASAWSSYAPHVMGRMVRDGMPSTQAADHVERQTDTARKYLLQELEHRPVLISRDPALHRFSIQGAKPRLVAGSSMQVSPLVSTGYNFDHDGDAMNYHVPVSDDAVNEIKNKLLPSQNLLSIKTRSVFNIPSQEFTLGLHASTTPNKKKPVSVFNTTAEAKAAYARQEIDIDSPIQILNP